MTRLGAALALLVLAAALCGCGQVSPKQVRIESSAVASMATEGQTVASEYGQGRMGWTFARNQLLELASQAGAPAASLGVGPAAPGVESLAAATQHAALETQRQLNRLAALGREPAERTNAEDRLESIASHMSDVSDQAEAIELAAARDPS